MKKHTTLLTIGIIVIVIPFLGVPSSWKAVFLVICGGLIISTAVAIRKDSRLNKAEQDEKKVPIHARTYIENDEKEIN
jgi:hypothetical protein